MRHPSIAFALIALAGCTTGGAATDPSMSTATTVQAALAADTRSPESTARDQYRHPAETLAFFGVKPDDTVVELWPGGGWYTEILAPYLKDSGSLTVAAAGAKGLNGVRKKAAANPAAYGALQYASFPVAAGETGIADGSADVVLTFRNIHNWRFGGADAAQANFDAIFKMLKPGGTLGVVEHRLPEARDATAEEKSGYMKESSVIGFATKAGFTMAGKSEINANPKDSADYPDGVWTLPPSYQLKDKDQAKYAAIGESDRMTIRFKKPG